MSISTFFGSVGARYERLRFGRRTWIAIGVLAVLIVPFLVVYVAEYQIADDADLKPNPAFDVQGGSRAVAMAATLMDAEINDGTWAPSRLWYHPLAYSSNMRNFQMGEQYAVSRFAGEMADLLGRDRGAGDTDPDLRRAKGALSFDPAIWSIVTSNGSVPQYEHGVEFLNSYNRRLAAGQARYDKIPANLSVFLDRINKDLQSQSAIIGLTVLGPGDYTAAQKQHMTDAERGMVSTNGGYFDSRASQVFYSTKGRLYAYYVILSAIGEDFHDVIEAKRVSDQWQDMIGTLRVAATYKKYWPANGARGDSLVPNDLVWQGYLLGRADALLSVLTDTISK
jgi:hypothetical protein